jgi:hypothetical protein
MNTPLSAPRAVSPGTYNDATTSINQILSLGHSLRFFPDVTMVGEEDFELLRRHHQLYALATGDSTAWHPMVSLGDSAVLRNCRDRVNAAGRDHEVDMWTAKLARCVQRLVQALPDKSAVFKPPLWSFPGVYNVVSQLSIAPPKNVLQGIATEDRDLFWKLACDLEDKFWGAIDWEVLHQDNLRTNPYYPVLLLASRGLYPIGLDSDLFIVFGRVPGSHHDR